MDPPLEESEERNRASFPRWGKLRVISYHFTELVLNIMEIRTLVPNVGKSCSVSILSQLKNVG